MKAVSNTTPLRYPIAIEQEHLLGQLFEKVFVPVAVHEELTDSRTPETVRGRVLLMPDWFEVRTVQETQTITFPVALHRGERQAILLAEALRGGVLLIDEQIGRTIALSRNLPLSRRAARHRPEPHIPFQSRRFSERHTRSHGIEPEWVRQRLPQFVRECDP